MKKEFAWAIAIGIIFGLIVAFGIWKVNQSIKNGKPNNIPTPSAKPTPVATSGIKINITTPENESISTSQVISVEGSIKPNIWIVISGAEDYLTKSDDEGKFSEEVNLDTGLNQLTITALENDLAIASSSLMVIYSSALESEEASGSAAIKPKAYIGTITDVTDLNLQIKTDKNEIKQISTSTEKTEVINIKEKPSKSVKLDEVAIGDYVAILGNVNSNSVLVALRILITTPLEKPTAKIVSAKYNEDDIKSDKNTVFYEYKDGSLNNIKKTAVDDEINVIYIENDSKIRTVFVVPI